MVVRALVLLLAVAALARPVIPTATSDASVSVAARFILADTSWSVHRGDMRARAAIDSIALALADSSGESRIAFTSNPRSALSGVVAWLETRHAATRELVVLSDFQRSSLDSVDLALVQPTVGLRLVPLAFVQPRDSSEAVVSLRLDDRYVSMSYNAGDSGTTVRYSRTGSPTQAPLPIEFEGIAAADEAALRTVSSFAGVVNPGSRETAHASQIIVHFAGSDSWDRLRASLSGKVAPQFREVVGQLAANRTIAELAHQAVAIRDNAGRESALVGIARNDAGTPLAEVGSDSVSSVARLHILLNVSPRTAVAGAVVASVIAYASGSTGIPEFDSDYLSQAALQSLQRSVPQNSSVSDGFELTPVLWMMALLALLVEALLRNRGKRMRREESEPTGIAA